MVKISIDLPDDVYRTVKEKAEAAKLTAEEAVKALLLAYFTSRGSRFIAGDWLGGGPEAKRLIVCWPYLTGFLHVKPGDLK
ncbi:MAG: hypothetical protein QXH91_04935 [Candidatus Bathyarchaeia archaeon]